MRRDDDLQKPILGTISQTMRTDSGHIARYRHTVREGDYVPIELARPKGYKSRQKEKMTTHEDAMIEHVANIGHEALSDYEQGTQQLPHYPKLDKTTHDDIEARQNEHFQRMVDAGNLRHELEFGEHREKLTNLSWETGHPLHDLDATPQERTVHVGSIPLTRQEYPILSHTPEEFTTALRDAKKRHFGRHTGKILDDITSPPEPSPRGR